MEDNNPAYWTDYNNLQRVKHALIEYYLNGEKTGKWIWWIYDEDRKNTYK